MVKAETLNPKFHPPATPLSSLWGRRALVERWAGPSCWGSAARPPVLGCAATSWHGLQPATQPQPPQPLLPFPGTAPNSPGKNAAFTENFGNDIAKIRHRKHTPSVVHVFSPYFCGETHEAACPVSCKWVALGVSPQADARPQRRAVVRHTTNPEP